MAIEFNNEDIRRDAETWEANKKAKAAARGPRKFNKLYANRWYQFQVVAASNRTAKTGTEQISLRCVPLTRDGDQAEKVSIFYNLNLPFRNPEVSGHVAPNTFNWCNRFLNAIYPETYPIRYGAEEMITAKEKLAEYHGAPESLIGEVFFGYVKDTEWNGNTRREVAEVAAFVADGEEPEYDNFIDSDS